MPKNYQVWNFGIGRWSEEGCHFSIQGHACLSHLPLPSSSTSSLKIWKVFKAFHIWKKTNLRLLSKHALLYETGSIDFCFQDELQFWRRNHLHTVWKGTTISPFYNYNHHDHHTSSLLWYPFEGKMHLSLCRPFRLLFQFKHLTMSMYHHLGTFCTLEFQLSWTRDCTIQETVFYLKLPTIPTHKSLEPRNPDMYLLKQLQTWTMSVPDRLFFSFVQLVHNRTSMCSSIGLSKLLHHSTQVWQSQFKCCFFSV